MLSKAAIRMFASYRFAIIGSGPAGICVAKTLKSHLCTSEVHL